MYSVSLRKDYFDCSSNGTAIIRISLFLYICIHGYDVSYDFIS